MAETAPGTADGRLQGGYINDVVRMGDEVHRPPSPNAVFVHTLLRHLEARGLTIAPRFLGFDEQGREVLSYIEGHAAWQDVQPLGVWSDESLLCAARMLRDLHDATAGTELARGAEAACHNDLSPRNTIYRATDGVYRPVAFIDWDMAAPGRRLEDLAEMCRTYLCPCPRHPLLHQHAGRINAISAAYGFEPSRRHEIAGLMLDSSRNHIDGIAMLAARGSRPHQDLIRTGALTSLGWESAWLQQNLRELEAAIDRYAGRDSASEG